MGRSNSAMRWLKALLLLVVVGAIVLVIDRQLTGHVHPDSSTIALVVIGLAIVLGILFPVQIRELSRRVTRLRVGGMELDLNEVLRSEVVVQRLPEQEEFGTHPVPPRRKTGTIDGDLAQIRGCLSERLFWLAAELHIESSDTGDITQQLRFQDLLDDDQAAFVMDLLAPGPADVGNLPETERNEYLGRAWEFANRIRPTVFDRAVRRDFRRQKWFLADFKQFSWRHRPDFLAMANGRWVLVAPRVALDSDSATNEETGQIAKTRNRWNSEPRPPIPLAGRLIVIPDESHAPESCDGDPAVVKRFQLAELLPSLAEARGAMVSAPTAPLSRS